MTNVAVIGFHTRRSMLEKEPENKFGFRVSISISRRNVTWHCLALSLRVQRSTCYLEQKDNCPVSTAKFQKHKSSICCASGPSNPCDCKQMSEPSQSTNILPQLEHTTTPRKPISANVQFTDIVSHVWPSQAARARFWEINKNSNASIYQVFKA